MFADNIIRIEESNLEELVYNIKTPDIMGRPEVGFLDINIDDEDIGKITVPYEKINIHMNKADFLTLNEAYEWMDSLHALYPLITDIDTLDYTATYNYPLIILKINGINPDEQDDRKGMLVMAMHHAREWQTVSTALFFADSLLSQYGYDSTATALMDSVFIVVYPVVNPDGYYYSRDLGNASWRKNRAYRNGNYGVDLNRNYPGGINTYMASDWGYPGNGACSHYPTNDLYCGPYEASEVETRSVQQLIKLYNFDISISLHSYGQEIMWPWGSIYEAAPDSQAMAYIGTEMANQIYKKNSSSVTYDAVQSVSLYPSTGDSDDWIYGYSKFVKGNTVFPFTYEIDNSFNSSSPEYLDTLYRNVYKGIYRGLNLVNYAHNNVNEIALMPELSLLGDTLTWTGINSSEAQYYRVYRMINPEISADTVNDDKLYNINGFYICSNWGHTDSFSFKDSTKNASGVSMSYANKYLVQPNDSLIFNVWYSIENNYDMAFIEISRDGYQWISADTMDASFNGTSGDWLRKSYPLAAYEGEQIYVRLRAVYDANTLFEGIYIDDIYPICRYEHDSLYADSIVQSHLLIYPDQFTEEYYSILPYSLLWGYTQESDFLQIDAFNFAGRDIDSSRIISSIEFNPLLRRIDINFITAAEKSVEIRLYNILGEKVYSVSANNDITIDLNHLNSGRYYINIQNEDYTRKGILILK